MIVGAAFGQHLRDFCQCLGAGGILAHLLLSLFALADILDSAIKIGGALSLLVIHHPGGDRAPYQRSVFLPEPQFYPGDTALSQKIIGKGLSFGRVGVYIADSDLFEFFLGLEAEHAEKSRVGHQEPFIGARQSAINPDRHILHQRPIAFLALAQHVLRLAATQRGGHNMGKGFQHVCR